jgi:hypothetical protein
MMKTFDSPITITAEVKIYMLAIFLGSRGMSVVCDTCGIAPSELRVMQAMSGAMHISAVCEKLGITSVELGVRDMAAMYRKHVITLTELGWRDTATICKTYGIFRQSLE